MATPKLTTFDDLYLLELRDLWDAERQLIEALPVMAAAATDPELKKSIRDHLAVTREQKKRLEQIFEDLGEDPEGHPCEAMESLIKEGSEIAEAEGDDAVRDAGIIAAAQRVEHYEISGYGSARTFARRLGRSQDVVLLQQSLDEEGLTDHQLTALAESKINFEATAA